LNLYYYPILYSLYQLIYLFSIALCHKISIIRTVDLV